MPVFYCMVCAVSESSKNVRRVLLRCTLAGKYGMTCLPHTCYLAAETPPSCYRLFWSTRTCFSNHLSIFFLNLFVLSRSTQNILLTAIIFRLLSHFERNPGVACILTLLATPIAYPRPLLAWFPIRRSCKQEASCTKKWRTRV